VGELDAHDRAWPESARLVCDERQPDGRAIYQIEADPEAGYLLRGPEYGAHLLSADARRLRCDPQGLCEARWQRLLIAQVLPFAAVLRGLEVFHASAAVHDGQAVAFLGRSGAGKSSLALELCGRGWGFLADDVLALECRDGKLLAHPGSPLAGVAHEHASSPRAREGAHEAQVVAVNARERLVRLPGARAPVTLAALFFLDRRADGPTTPGFEPLADAQALLGATFNFIHATPARLRGLLDVCALAARGRVERVVCGQATSVSQLAAAVERRLEAR
jgi:HPr kinase/phosphorylase